MSQDSERIKKLISFKKRIETRIEKVNNELKELQATLETVNSILLEKGFKRADTVKEMPADVVTEAASNVVPEASSVQPTQISEQESVIPLKTTEGELLANLYIVDDSMRVVLAEDKSFNINTPPFTHFLVERVLLKMQERDSELARARQLSPERIFCYNVIREGDLIREIVMKNLDSDRLRELKSSVRWTLEKMYEKIKKPV